MKHLPCILTPVSEEHLLSGRDVCQREGKVAFGSRAFSLFEQADELRDEAPLDVFIYPSWGSKFGPPKARWHGVYIGHVRSNGGAHPDGMKFRPRSTKEYPSDNIGHWAVFYELEALRELPKEEALGMPRFRGFGTGKPYVTSFIPEGPLLVDVV